jgi:hypothetical protein
MAQNNKQFILPDGTFLDTKNEDEQWMTPSGVFLDEEAAAVGGADIRKQIISAYKRINK